MKLKWRNDGAGWVWFDIITSCFVSSFLHSLSLFLSSFLPTQQQSISSRTFWILIVSPISLSFSLLFLPCFLVGTLLRILLCATRNQTRTWNSLNLDDRTDNAENRLDEGRISVGTTNVMLGLEVWCRWQNISGVYSRLQKVVKAIDDQSGEYEENLKEISTENLEKQETIRNNFPRMDIICFQEVHERIFALILILLLRNRYSNFIFDIGENSWNINRFMMSSGLFVASKYPVLDAEFFPFTQKKSWQSYISYGVLVFKVDLGNNRVGIISNLHTVAYQGKDDLLSPALDELHNAMARFKARIKDGTERIVFECIAGDFNFDNMSPSEIKYSKHPVFQQYNDVCIKKPGVDHAWSIGTELRQLEIGKPEVSTPEQFRNILCDDLRRRYYILDADVQEQNFDLMTISPRKGKNGVCVCPEGGRRRIDRILINKQLATIRGVCFCSCLVGITDHVPLVVTAALL
ncbi:sphingomyelin phosphodiesterase 5 isoform X1 [Eurytemora carolleeae]|uniref:sphingomyelin phosphodiesterase 5 isoform X1 n=1 Tax=Eurytemora carolleeae TaxID=1294199 RepID=UPI000C7841D5|nr:sphingomyelin phosphodiesterase 5 isoform X1 [Eurytemora carolleeae]|eukprot:XP_023344322.1 sphingomyelin phosphodiesterase 5-like isoform X1 [Eurytemora affinis]